jgi:metal-responsive CopG/Arc/MetJ family transcriptional regulator
MRLHIEIDDRIVNQIDEIAGPRGRSKFIRDAITSALEHRKRRALIASARGSIGTTGHAWDQDPGEWVRAQRRADRRKVG